MSLFCGFVDSSGNVLGLESLYHIHHAFLMLSASGWEIICDWEREGEREKGRGVERKRERDVDVWMDG